MSWFDWLPTVIQAGTTLYGASQAADANVRAAQISAGAQTAATNAQLQGQQLAADQLKAQQAAASPGLTATQDVIRRGSAITPAQQIAIDDATRTTVNQLGASGLRGSARATSAVLADNTGRTTANFMQGNQQKADAAAGQLTGQYFNTGTNIANNSSAQGTTAATGLTATGDVNANLQTANGNVQGKAIGDIGAVIADEIKAQNRGTSYKPTTSGGI